MTAALRHLRVGDRVPASALGRMPARRLAATALIIPGAGGLDAYLARLRAAQVAFDEWDGRVELAEADGEPTHRLLVVDRYRQIYAAHDGNDLPDVGVLTEWFRFLATACPECGVPDDPLLTGPTP
ncbi:MAG TPA: hypothetical protein VLA76_12340 [Candidatus Angelobacter sp.]|nr:hypothetical protein [Candidatus Angelobacter sp.]